MARLSMNINPPSWGIRKRSSPFWLAREAIPFQVTVAQIRPWANCSTRSAKPDGPRGIPRSRSSRVAFSMPRALWLRRFLPR
ncbi:hypothetical protein D9M71_741440 [compost metagenome]